MNAVGASSLSVFKFALVLLLLTVSAPAFARASTRTEDRDVIREVVEATLRAQEEGKKAPAGIPTLLMGAPKEDPEPQVCGPSGALCNPKVPSTCCSGKCMPFFYYYCY